MICYDRSAPHDLALAAWWARLQATGDLDRTFLPSMRPLGAFLSYWRTNVVLYFDVDADGLTCAAWLEPVMSDAFYSLWLRQDKRQSKASLAFIRATLELGLSKWPVLLGMTRQPALLDGHRKLGYTVLADIPHLWNGDTVYLVALTQSSYTEAQHGRLKARQPSC